MREKGNVSVCVCVCLGVCVCEGEGRRGEHYYYGLVWPKHANSSKPEKIENRKIYLLSTARSDNVSESLFLFHF